MSVAWIPVLQGSNSGQLFIYMQSVTSSLAPPVTAVFVLGIFWRRANEQVGRGALGWDRVWASGFVPSVGWAAACSNLWARDGGTPDLHPVAPAAPAALPPPPQGAFWGLMAGLALGAMRLVLEFLNPTLPCGDLDTRPAILSSIHYLHFAVALFTLSGLVVVAGSLLTSPPHGAQVSLP